MADLVDKTGDAKPNVAHVDDVTPPDTINEKDIEAKAMPRTINTDEAPVSVTPKTWAVVFVGLPVPSTSDFRY